MFARLDMLSSCCIWSTNALMASQVKGRWQKTAKGHCWGGSSASSGTVAVDGREPREPWRERGVLLRFDGVLRRPAPLCGAATTVTRRPDPGVPRDGRRWCREGGSS